MQKRSRAPLAIVVSALVLLGIGAGVALAQTPSPSPSASEDWGSETTGRSGFLDAVAGRLGIERSDLDAALEAQALDGIQWAQDNGFITETRANELREAVQDAGGALEGFGPFGLHGPGIDLGGLGDGFGMGGGPFTDRLGDGSGVLSAAAEYLGISESELLDELDSKALVEVAADLDRPIDGLAEALRDAVAAGLDDAVADLRITRDQADALLERFDAGIGDLINGIPPSLADLADRLGVDRSALIAALRGARIDQVDAALAEDLITQDHADLLRERIQNTPLWPFGGMGPCGGLGPGFGRPGGFAPGHGRFHGFGFGPGQR